jgi:hypothetical protein
MTTEQEKLINNIEVEAHYIQHAHMGDSNLLGHIAAIYDYTRKLRKSL